MSMLQCNGTDGVMSGAFLRPLYASILSISRSRPITASRVPNRRREPQIARPFRARRSPTSDRVRRCLRLRLSAPPRRPAKAPGRYRTIRLLCARLLLVGKVRVASTARLGGGGGAQCRGHPQRPHQERREGESQHEEGIERTNRHPAVGDVVRARHQHQHGRRAAVIASNPSQRA